MRTLLRVAVTATFLYGSLALGIFALSEPAYPQGSEHAKAEPNLTLPEANPIPCKLPLWYLAELPGWRVLEGAQAKAYLAAAFNRHPPADAVAFTVVGSKAALVLAKDGCVVGRKLIAANTHAKVMVRAFGWVV